MHRALAAPFTGETATFLANCPATVNKIPCSVSSTHLHFVRHILLELHPCEECLVQSITRAGGRDPADLMSILEREER